MTGLRCWLLLDGVDASFPGIAATEAGPVVALRLAGYEPAAGATEWLRYPDVVADRIQFYDPAGPLLSELPCPAPEAVWTHLPYDRRADARRVVAGPDGPAAPRLVPTFLVTVDGDQVHVHSCCRIRESGLLFARIWSGPADPGGSPVVARLAACAAEPVLRWQCADESDQMTHFEGDVEIELKLTLRGPASAWGIACDLAAAVQDRQVAGFLPDLGNELQRWTYEQDTFEVSGPPGKNGYVAFMTGGDGRYLAKYKLFGADALRRVETFDDPLRLEPAEFADHIRAHVGTDITLRPLPHLVRTRFDVNVESAATGHFFGLEMDEVWAGGQVLRQLEIEYHRTRVCFGTDGRTIDRELFALADRAERLLGEWGVPADRGYLSKLTFLRGVADGPGQPAD